jgi:hypothetical protein
MHSKHRLRSNADFRRIRSEGRSLVHPLLVISMLPNGLQYSRFASRSGASHRQGGRAKPGQAADARIGAGEVAKERDCWRVDVVVIGATRRVMQHSTG